MAQYNGFIMGIPQLSNMYYTPSLVKIGAGACGTVFAEELSDPERLDGSRGLVLKREDGNPNRDIGHESAMLQHILVTFALQVRTAQVEFLINIPSWYAFLDESFVKWGDILPRLPASYSANPRPCRALISERIPPMPRSVRDLLVRKFCPVEHQEQIMADPANRHCLIRLYLGRRKDTASQSRFRSFKLQNFPLHLNQITELGIPQESIREYATALADALAYLHWVAEVDANDVEFVLAPSRTPFDPSSDPHLGYREFSPGVLGRHALWMLDFDCCRPMEMNEKGVEQAADAFWRNDPYFPRPHLEGIEEDGWLWRAFEQRFLWTSVVLLLNEPQYQRLPGLLMQRIVQRANRQGVGGSGAAM